MKAALWLTSPDKQEGFAKPDATEEERLACCHIATHDYDMTTSGWVRVGEVEVTVVSLSTDSEIRRDLVSAIETQIQNLRAETQMQINLLEDRKNQLLCLEAPK